MVKIATIAKSENVSRYFKDDRNEMKKFKEIQTLVIILLLTVFNFGCKEENHIDKYDVNVDSLKILPNGFYAYRRGNIFLTAKNL